MSFLFRRKDRPQKLPTDELRNEAKLNPGGWVYEIHGEFTPDEDIPPQAIAGAWKVDEQGNIVGDFIPNPNFTGSQTP